MLQDSESHASKARDNSMFKCVYRQDFHGDGSVLLEKDACVSRGAGCRVEWATASEGSFSMVLVGC